MLLMVKRCHFILFIDIQKLIAHTRKIETKIKYCHFLNIGMSLIYMERQCHKNPL